MKLVPGGDNLVKGVQCYELFGGIALKNHAFSFFILTSYTLNILHFVCIVSSSIPSLVQMGQREPPQAVLHHLAPSRCTMASEVKRRGVQEEKNIDYAKQHHTPHCWFPANVMDPANSTKRK